MKKNLQRKKIDEKLEHAQKWKVFKINRAKIVDEYIKIKRRSLSLSKFAKILILKKAALNLQAAFLEEK